MSDKQQWEAIANHSKFIELKRKKRNFLFSWWIISTIYYLLLPVISGYFPEAFRIKVIGPITPRQQRDFVPLAPRTIPPISAQDWPMTACAVASSCSLEHWATARLASMMAPTGRR